MALLLTSQPFLCLKKSKPIRLLSLQSVNPSLSFSTHSPKSKFSSFRIYCSYSHDDSDPDSFAAKTPKQNEDSDKKSVQKSSEDDVNEDESAIVITDEWGEKAEVEAKPEASSTKFSDADPPKDDDEEWKEEDANDYINGNGSPTSDDAGYDNLRDLKRALVDSVYGTEFGFRASGDVRAEVLELVHQLEALNPTLAPVEASSKLDGNWVLLYTAFSELLPILAAGATPLLKVKKICQKIDTQNLTIDNIVTFSNPFATFSFSAGATFEVRSPSRIQVRFKEGTIQPPEIKPNVDLPGDLEVFGQKISLAPLQQSLGPLQQAVVSVTNVISGQPPLKVPIPGERTASWLLTTYLDDDIRISRGDGGLFVLTKEGSPYLSQ